MGSGMKLDGKSITVSVIASVVAWVVIEFVVRPAFKKPDPATTE